MEWSFACKQPGRYVFLNCYAKRTSQLKTKYINYFVYFTISDGIKNYFPHRSAAVVTAVAKGSQIKISSTDIIKLTCDYELFNKLIICLDKCKIWGNDNEYDFTSGWLESEPVSSIGEGAEVLFTSFIIVVRILKLHLWGFYKQLLYLYLLTF